MKYSLCRSNVLYLRFSCARRVFRLVRFIALFLSAAMVLSGCKALPRAASVHGTEAEIKVVDGAADLYLNGKKMSRMWGRADLPPLWSAEKVAQFAPAGIEVYFTAMGIPNHMCWNGREGYNFKHYEAYLDDLIAEKPDIRLILFVGFSGPIPYLWCKDHPDQLTQSYDGTNLNVASLGSESWLKDSCKAFERFVRHFENSPYAKHIIGYNPILSGNEWFGYMRENSIPGSFQDYSIPMRTLFGRWLRNHYNNNLNALRKSWKNETVTFETAQIPTPAERLNADMDTLFPYLHKGNQVPDYFRCYHERNAEIAIEYCKTIKQALTTPKLAGVMHGYSYCARHAGHYPQHVASNGGVQMILDSPWVDFVHSPYSYYNRNFGGVHYSQQAVDSYIQHGKLMVDQIDTKTHLKPGDNTNAKTPWQTRQVLIRDVAYSLSKNCACYWLDIGTGVFRGQSSAQNWERLHFDDPQITNLIADLKKLTDENDKRRTKSVTQTALITSNADMYYRRPENTFGNLYVEAMRQWILPEVGAPFDDYVLEDFENIKRSYRCYIFVNAHYVPSGLRKTILRKLNDEKATAIWFYAPGYIDETGYSVDHIRELTGISVASIDKLDYVQVQLAPSADPYLHGVDVTQYGSDCNPNDFQKSQEWLAWPLNKKEYRLNPQFYADDTAARVLGTLAGINQPGLVVKKTDSANSIYSSAPLLPVSILRNILKAAGVHLYSCQGDLIYANSGYVCISAKGDGTKSISLPGAFDVFDAMDGASLGRDVSRVDLAMKHGQTTILRLEK